MQESDLALGGLDDAEVVIATGLDRNELPAGRLDGLVVQEVPERQLGALCHGWAPRGPEPVGRPSVRQALGPILERLWTDGSTPLTGARAALHLSGALPDDGVVVADPGPVGFWVARAAPSSFPGAICVPSTVEPGFAAAGALVARLDGRPCLAVTDAEGSRAEATAAVLDLAGVMAVPVALQVWGEDGTLETAGEHVALLEEILETGPQPVRKVPVPVDLSIPDDLSALAGAVTAW